MGVIAQGISAYAQPLVDQTDGSPDQIQAALSMAMICWNVAILPDAQHDEFLTSMRGSLKMGDEEFRAFRREIVEPMIRRHREMFPKMAISSANVLPIGSRSVTSDLASGSERDPMMGSAQGHSS
jgi:hypothetical protein